MYFGSIPVRFGLTGQAARNFVTLSSLKMPNLIGLTDVSIFIRIEVDSNIGRGDILVHNHICSHSFNHAIEIKEIMQDQNNSLTVPQQTHFQTQGYVIIEDLYSRDAMQALKQHAIDMCLDPTTPTENVKWNAKAKAESEKYQGAQALHSFWRPHTISEPFRNLCADPTLTDRLASILGPDVVTFNGLAIFKSSEIGLAFPYHQDMWYFQKNNDIAQSCAIWLALDDADEENGCLWVVPESHSGRLYDHVEPAGEYNQQEFREVLEAREMEEVSVQLQSGSALFFDGRLLHRSGPNKSRRDRACYVIHNTSADTRFSARPGTLEYRAIMKTRGDRNPQFLPQ